MDRCVRLALILLLSALGTRSMLAQSSLSLAGEWTAPFDEDGDIRAAQNIGNLMGVPINDAARRYVDSWRELRWTLPEHQCIPHAVNHSFRGPANARIWEEKDPYTQDPIAIKTFIATFAQSRTIWLDGRPHPSEYAAHTWQGFSTGRWEGNMLTVDTTHIKHFFHRRPGVPSSDRVELTEHFIRHGDIITVISAARDPVYLTETLVHSEHFLLNRNVTPETYQTHTTCQPDEENPDQQKGYVPHFLPGTNPFVNEFADKYGIPREIRGGGAESMYPEFQARIKELQQKK
jgi:hypothetical protein